MTGRMVADVSWGALNSGTALYGTALTMSASGEVRLVNDLMPSGTTIQEWYSFTDYQSVRDAPTLPLLHHGKVYRLEPDLAAIPADSVMFHVRYFDRFGKLIRADILYPPLYAFEYSADCHHYTIRLTSAGCDELRFTSFRLSEATVEEVREHGAR